MQSHAPFVASLATDVTPFATPQPEVVIVRNAQLRERGFAVPMRERFILFLAWLIRLLTVTAERLRETLRQHSQERIGEQKRVHPHLQEPGHRFDRAIGMKRAEDQVSRERGFDTDFRGFAVADFSHHDDIRVGTQKRPHRGGEVEVNAWVHLHLSQTRLRDFDRVFRRPDFPVWGIDERERGVQRRGLSRSRGADTQNHAVGFL